MQLPCFIMHKKSQFVLASCLAFTCGIALASFVFIIWPIVFGFILAGAVLIILSRQKNLLRLAGFCLLFFALGIARFNFSINKIDQTQIAFYNKQKVVFEGLVSEEPDAREDHVKLILSVKNVYVNGNKITVKGKVLLKSDLYPGYHYGDLLGVSCLLQQPEPIEDFAYDKYLAKEDIYSLCYKGKIQLLSQNNGNFFKSKIIAFKELASSALGKTLKEPSASFLAGLLWGAKKGLPKEVTSNFQAAGFSHLVAVSGYNLSVIANAIMYAMICMRFKRQKATVVSALALFLFVVFTGWQASIVRAAAMAYLVILCSFASRRAKKANILFLAAALILFLNPKLLIWDAGFQLSFLATAGLLYLSRFFKRRLSFLSDKFSLRENASATLSATIATLPVIIINFKRFSTLAVIANLLVLPLMPVIMLFGFILLVISLISADAGIYFSWLVWPMLTYVLKVAEFFAGLSWAHVSL